MHATEPAERIKPVETFVDTAAPEARPIYLVPDAETFAKLPLTPMQRTWLTAQGFKPGARRPFLVPNETGAVAAVVIGAAPARETALPSETLLGLAGAALPGGTYALASTPASPELAATAFGLGAYQFNRYRSIKLAEPRPRLAMPAGVDGVRTKSIVEAVTFGRDLINAPSNDLGPAELEAAARSLAATHGAGIRVITGGDLLTENFPMIHAVGRASTRAPRLIDLTWAPHGNQTGPRITIVGKGICFDTGGLDIKPSAGMLLMKKDMGGAAAALALGHMIMANALPVRLRILIAAAENSISGNAFRPGDVLTSRSGQTIEIGNTDAEGRLVMADALTLADEDRPDTVITLSTLTGAARVALGPEVVPFYSTDDALAASLVAAGQKVADPLWRMPFWPGYESMLESPVADMNNVSESAFAGSVVAALFLKRFVVRAKRFAHFDIFAWRPSVKALGPKGAEVQAARAVFEVLRNGG